jgi:N-acetylmuramoyl-L-alanine amidase
MASTKLALVFSLLLALQPQAGAQKITALGSEPNWPALEAYQETITREEFTRLLTNVYAPDDSYKPFIEINGDSALIKKTLTPPHYFKLRFAADAGVAKQTPRYWHPASALTASDKPLAGLKIALDPGHLGGKWAKMEERWYQMGDSKPVTEGDMTLTVAKILAPKLEALGADVFLVHGSPGPTTSDRPADLRREARAELRRQGVKPIRRRYSGPDDPHKRESIQWESELLFYRTSEIHHRAAIVNRRIKPDLTLCLHFNAEEWHNPAAPTFVDKNHLHLLVNGYYSAAELSFDDTRFEMLRKLLGGCYSEEFAIAEKVAGALAVATGLPPYEYLPGKALRSSQNPYIWMRNLLANRLYRCPVVYCEPYVMNCQPVFERIQMGDYEGERSVAGVMRKSIYREYADAVADGMAAYYGAARKN